MSFRRILIASDLGPISDAPLRRALELGRALGAQLFALHVNEAPHDASEHWLSPFFGPELEAYRAVTRRHEEAARARLAEQIERARTAAIGAPPIALQIRQGRPAEIIVAAAAELDCELIVLGTRGRVGTAGSVAERVVRDAGRAVLVVPPG